MSVRGRGRGRGFERQGIGPPVKCKCPNCGHETSHEQSVPCAHLKCPNCNIPLIGAD